MHIRQIVQVELDNFPEVVFTLSEEQIERISEGTPLHISSEDTRNSVAKQRNESPLDAKPDLKPAAHPVGETGLAVESHGIDESSAEGVATHVGIYYTLTFFSSLFFFFYLGL